MTDSGAGAHAVGLVLCTDGLHVYTASVVFDDTPGDNSVRDAAGSGCTGSATCCEGAQCVNSDGNQRQ